jgi:hypothetical protein
VDPELRVEAGGETKGPPPALVVGQAKRWEIRRHFLAAAALALLSEWDHLNRWMI